MNFAWSEEEEAFRREVRQFLSEELTDDVRGNPMVDTPARVAFVDKMAERGWLSMGFPEEYGGTRQTIPLAQFILNHELKSENAPLAGMNSGVIAHTILHNGSEELKREFLPKIFKNHGQWAICYSEPEAGSDLASLQCRAALDGDDFVINGQKRFITGAHFADYYWAAVRTDADAPKHKGISLIIIDAKTPGITLTPQWCLGKTHVERTNEVFFDDVRVPRSRLVGELNRGWYYMMEALNYERFVIMSFSQLKDYERIIEWAREAEIGGKRLADDPIVRAKIGRLATMVEVSRMLEIRCIAAAAHYVPANESAMAKAWGAILVTELADAALDIMGPYGYVWGDSEEARVGAIPGDLYFMAGHSRVAGAGVDIAMGIIARRLLQMPAS